MRAILLSVLALLLGQCHKKDPDPARPEDQLPAATQTGANTFGCLVNGQPYTPGGNNGTSNYAVLYDPTFQGGNLQVETYQYVTDKAGARYQRSVSFASGDINRVGQYIITSQSKQILLFTDRSKNQPCNWYANGSGIYTSGTLTITRLDQQAGIISGTFSFTLAQPGCDRRCTCRVAVAAYRLLASTSAMAKATGLCRGASPLEPATALLVSSA